MINEQVLNELWSWYEDYMKSFSSDDPEYQRNIDLKDEHSRRVSQEIRLIGKSLSLNTENLQLAEIMALFHDIGRFEQYERYGTYSDPDSEDHAEIGIRILRRHGILNSIDHEKRELIVRTIGYHNRATLPENETEECMFFTKLLRDADKLDIWFVMTEYYHERNCSRNHILELDLPDVPEISEKVCDDLKEGRIVKMGHVTTLNDFKLLQLGWIFDVNFEPTFQVVQERGYLESIRDALPQSKKAFLMYSLARAYLEKNIGSPSGGTMQEDDRTCASGKEMR